MKYKKKQKNDLRLICPTCFSIVQYEEYRDNNIGSQGIYFLQFNDEANIDIECDLCKSRDSITKWAEIFVKLTGKERTFRYIINEKA